MISISYSGGKTYSSRSELEQGFKKGGKKTPCWSAPAVLESEQLYVDAYCHGEALNRMSALHAFFWKGPTQFS
jgi:hypothetical protein